MPPHVFVLFSDVRRVSCDAWAAPAVSLNRNRWFDDPPSLCASARSGTHTRTKLSERICRTDQPGYSGPVLYQVDPDFRTASDMQKLEQQYAVASAEFVTLAAADLKARGVRPRNRRACHLLALPILGTRYGGCSHSAGVVLKELLPRVVEAATLAEVDVAIVTNEPEAYAAAQAQRRMMGYSWPLSPVLLAQADALAEHGRKNQLVLFTGAGISIASGLPTWDGLLEKLAESVGLGKEPPKSDVDAVSTATVGPVTTCSVPPSPVDDKTSTSASSVSSGAVVSVVQVVVPKPCPEETSPEPPPIRIRRSSTIAIARHKRERKEYDSLPRIDQARIIESRMAKAGRSFGESVAKELMTDFHSPCHCLLAAMPCDEAVTTNYDQLYEQAVECVAPGTLSVLPINPKQHSKRWLLKMHGCVTIPQEIVFTRKDYIRYAETNAALGGILQALMMTKHMLFVGFSLQDDNFHRLFDSVQRARKPADVSTAAAPSEKLGTVLCVECNTLQEELWGDHLNFVFMSPAADGTPVALPSSGSVGVGTGTGPATASVPLPSPTSADGTSVQSIPESARTQEIFLDYLTSQCNRLEGMNFLNVRYKEQLSEEEVVLHEALLQFVLDLPPSAMATSAFGPLKEVLGNMGVDFDDLDGLREAVKAKPPPGGFGSVSEAKSFWSKVKGIARH